MPIDDDDKIMVVYHDSSTGEGIVGSITKDELGLPLVPQTGWGDYADTEYTSVSPFVPTVDTWVPLPNNALAGPRSQEPDGIEFYTDGKITGRNGDAILITAELTATPTSSTETFLDIAINIGGAIGRIYPQTLSFPKGQGQARNLHFTVGAYTLDTWEANGGQVEVRTNAGVNIYNIRYVITRTHEAR